MFEYIQDPATFKELSLEDQLSVIADLILYCAVEKTNELEKAGKTRVDSSIAAQRWHNQEKYWENVQMNIKKLAELEMTKVKRGA